MIVTYAQEGKKAAHTAFFNFQKVPRRFKSAFAFPTFYLLLSKPLFAMRSEKGHQLPCKRFALACKGC